MFYELPFGRRFPLYLLKSRVVVNGILLQNSVFCRVPRVIGMNDVRQIVRSYPRKSSLDPPSRFPIPTTPTRRPNMRCAPCNACVATMFPLAVFCFSKTELFLKNPSRFADIARAHVEKHARQELSRGTEAATTAAPDGRPTARATESRASDACEVLYVPQETISLSPLDTHV